VQRRRFILEGLSANDRFAFAEQVFSRLAEDLRAQYLRDRGSRMSWDEARKVLLISRGNFWGLKVGLRARDEHLKIWDWKFDAFFPAIDRIGQRFGNPERGMPQSGIPRFFAAHILMPLLLIPVLVALPFLALYRIALLALWGDVSGAAHRLDLLWPSIQSLWSGPPPELRRHSLLLVLSLSTAVSGVAGVACFRLEDPSFTNNWIFVAGIVLLVVSLCCLIGLVMTFLGFEVRK